MGAELDAALRAFEAEVENACRRVRMVSAPLMAEEDRNCAAPADILVPAAAIAADIARGSRAEIADRPDTAPILRTSRRRPVVKVAIRALVLILFSAAVIAVFLAWDGPTR